METGGEIRDELGTIRKHILILLYREAEPVGTRELRKDLREDYGVELKRGSKEHHFARLGDGDEDRGVEGWGLITEAYRSGKNIEERYWRLTDRGKEFVEGWILHEESAADEEYTSRFERLASRVDELEKRSDRQQRELDNLWDKKAAADRIDEIEDTIAELTRAVEELHDRLEEQEQALDDQEQRVDALDREAADLRDAVEQLTADLREGIDRLNEIEQAVEQLADDQNNGLFSFGRQE